MTNGGESNNGKFIVFEGGEGCGKTTQLARLSKWLMVQPHPPTVVCTREPGGTELGTQLRQLLLNRDQVIAPAAELLLYAADRAHHVDTHLRPHLNQGTWVLCDRYTDSTVAYQGYGRGLDLGLIDQLNQIATGGLASHLTLWLDLDVEVGLARTRQRGLGDRMEQADLAFHQRVRAGFQALHRQFPERITRIDASLSEADVAAQIQAVVQQWLPGC